MPWWIWAAGGLLFLLLELLLPSDFFLFFFGCGALLVALLVSSGMEAPLWGELLVFLVLSLSAAFWLRRPFLERFRLQQPAKAVDSLAGETAVVQSDIPAGGIGKAMLRGSPWSARNNTGAALIAGDRCRVERLEGLTLWLTQKEGD